MTAGGRSRNPVKQAVCEARGWPYCETHDRPKYHGDEACVHLHATTPPLAHVYWCEWPLRDCVCPA